MERVKLILQGHTPQTLPERMDNTHSMTLHSIALLKYSREERGRFEEDVELRRNDSLQEERMKVDSREETSLFLEMSRS